MPENPLLQFLPEDKRETEELSLELSYPETQLSSDVENPLLQFLPEERKELTPTGLPSMRRQRIPEYDVQPHVGAAERFGKRFAEAFVPFTWYEPDLPDPSGFGETLTGAIGSVFGFLAGSIPFAIMTGGASVPLTAIDKTSKIYKG